MAHQLFDITGRVVVVTGYDDVVLRRDVGEIHGELLLKPVRITQLKNAVYACDPEPSVVRHQA